MKYRDRIIGTVRIRGDRLLAHPKNWRVHPENQREAMRGVLADLGVVVPFEKIWRKWARS